MKTALILALLVTATAVTVSADAQTYQWKDSRGRTVISDTPPPGSAKTAQTLNSPQTPATPGEKTTDAAKSTADKDLDFKKRQQDAKDKADKEAKEKTAAAEKAENCERARRNLAALEGSRPLAQLDETGQQKIMDNGQREQEKERARKILTDSCK